MSQEPINATGQRRPQSDANQFSAIIFVIKQYLAGVRTAMPVIVRGVRNPGGVEPVGSVDVEPLVAQLDGTGNIVAHGIIYDIPYFRIQGGKNAVIIDPDVGDIGLAVVADRDVTNVKATKSFAAPGSKRRNHFSDGFYFGGFMNGKPEQYIHFATTGINIVSPVAINMQAPNIILSADTAITLKAPDIELDGALEQGSGEYGGDASFGSDVTAVGEVEGKGVKLSGHGHDKVQPGDGQSGKPVNI